MNAAAATLRTARAGACRAPARRHAYVRWFRYPLGELREDGQPMRDWDWFVAIEMHAGSVLWAFGAKGMPTMDEFRDVLTAAARLGATTLAFEHRGRPHYFNLSKYQKQNKMKDATSTVVIGPAVVLGPDGTVEGVAFGGVIPNLTSEEAGQTLRDLQASVNNFNPVTGEPAKD